MKGSVTFRIRFEKKIKSIYCNYGLMQNINIGLRSGCGCEYSTKKLDVKAFCKFSRKIVELYQLQSN